MANTSRFRKVAKEELASIVERQIKTSVGYYDSKLSRERQEVLDYYNAKLPRPSHDGNSKYVSMDVFDSVESMKAVLLETFSAGNKIVAFEPENEDDVIQCRNATAYCDYVVFRQNDGFKLFGEIITDALMARVGVAKVYWNEKVEKVTETFDNLMPEQIDMLLAADDVEDVKVELDPETGTYQGELTRTVDKSQVQIDVVAPEEFLITPQAKDIQSAPFVAHRTKKTLSDLIKEGYDKSLVERITNDESDRLTLDPEVLARFEDIGADRLNLDGQVQEQSRHVTVYECYLYLDMEGTGKTCLYKVTKAGNVILDSEEVDKKPFIHFCPIPTPHAFYGSNYAARVIPTQNARTVLVRGILDHTVITNNPRYMVVKGALVNPKEMIENRVGGLVNVNRPDGLLPLPQSGLNPFVFQTIQLLDEDKEEATGVSKLSQGLNKDAISKQNSQGMVENLVSLSQQREKIIARHFANQFVKPLYLEVYRLVLNNEKQEKVIKVGGEYQRILPSSWQEKTDCTVELKLGYGEQERDSQKMVMLHQMLMADPEAPRIYNTERRYAMYRDIFDKSGIKNVVDYLTNPQQLPPPQPDPMQVKTMELEERQVAVQERIAMTQAEKVQMNAQMDQMKVELDRMRLALEKFVKTAEVERKEFEATSRAAIAAEELDMAKDQMAYDPNLAKAIISPNS